MKEWPSASRYEDLLASTAVSQPLREPGLLEVENGPDELTWQSRWFSGAFGRDFVSHEGQPVRVVHFGWWNHGAGPDFRDCVVEIDGETRRGSIELDRSVRDWDAHGHSTNPAYEDTVLHLLLTSPRQPLLHTRTSAHRAVPQVYLPVQPQTDWQDAAEVPAARPGRCARALLQSGSTEILRILESAARYRIERKARRWLATAEVHGMDQTLYQGMAAALGYRNNQTAMTVIAPRLPLSWLQQRPDDAEALLYGAAGFLEGPAFDAAGAEDTRVYLRGLWEHWWRYRAAFSPGAPCHPVRWVIAGTRPVNHPHRRLAALWQIASRWRSLRRGLTPEMFDPEKFTVSLAALQHSYWDVHYTLTSKAAPARMALIGGPRAVDMMINLLYPLFLHERPSLWGSYTSLGSVQENEKTRIAAIRLFGSESAARPHTRKAWQQQALLQLYEDFCLHDLTDCASCPWPEQMQSHMVARE